jgi:chemotaxis protein methyltransferase CheR
MAQFDFLNLNDNTYPSLLNGTNAQDLILCRNVLIYFDDNSIARLMRRLSASLVTGGYLLLGASDPINIKNTDLVFHHQAGSLFSRPAMKPKEAIIQPALYTPKEKMPVYPLKKPTPPTPAPVRYPQPSLTLDSLLNEARWQEVLDMIASHERNKTELTASLLNAKITALTNLGKLEQAIQCCKDNLHRHPTNIHIHFMLAMALNELNHTEEAEAELRRTLFLDRQFVIGHFQLGLMLLRNAQHAEGIKSLQNAMTIAKAKPATETVTGFTNMNYGQLSEVLSHEIELHSTMLGRTSYDNKNTQTA